MFYTQISMNVPAIHVKMVVPVQMIITDMIALVKLVTLERIVKQVGQHITINYRVTFF